MATAEAELERMEAKLKNETGVAMAQRDFDIKKGWNTYSFTEILDIKGIVLVICGNKHNRIKIS